MITTKDIEKILIRDMSRFIDVSHIFVEDDIPDGDVTEERVTIHVKEMSPQVIFKRCFVEVNWCVPDVGTAPAHERLLEIEHQMVANMDSTWEYDDSVYRYDIQSHRVFKSELKCHYVNSRILFEVLNTK